MNSLLLSEISSAQTDALDALVLLEEHIFEYQMHGDLHTQLNDIAEQCQQAMASNDDPLQQVEAFLSALFVDQLFIESPKRVLTTAYLRSQHALSYRQMSPALKVILIQYLAQRCQLDVDVVFVPDKLMVRIICDDEYAIIFDVMTGEPINWAELDQRMDELEGDPERIYLKSETTKSLMVHYLTALKNSLINDADYYRALRCVELLLALQPDDPLERRDRGFLLHQLDCFKVAYDDYQYFIEQRPQDPAAQLLKLQIEYIKLADNILH